MKQLLLPTLSVLLFSSCMSIVNMEDVYKEYLADPEEKGLVHFENTSRRNLDIKKINQAEGNGPQIRSIDVNKIVYYEYLDSNIFKSNPPIIPPYKLLFNGFEVIAQDPLTQPT